MAATEFQPTALLRRLVDTDVDFVVVGGVAVVLQGSPRYTKDLDICYSTTPENLRRLGDLLVAIHARLRGVAEEVPFVPDARTLAGIRILTLETDLGSLDLLVEPAGAARYEVLRDRADVVNIDGVTVRIASVGDLLAMKRAAGRGQDIVDIEALEIIRRRGGRRRRRTR